MKFIQYHNSLDEQGIEACCIAAYSARKNGNLPNCSFVFYHTKSEEVKNIPIVKVAFDEVLPLPEKALKTLNSLPNYVNWIHKSNRHLSCWSKFLCWLFTDGDCILTDYDVLCLGSIREAIPKSPNIISGFKAGGKQPVFIGSVLGKNASFDYSGARDVMLTALLNQDIYIYTQKKWNWIDEAAVWYYFHCYGMGNALCLERKFNMGLWWLDRHPKDFKDIRLLHFVSNYKPWNNVEGCEKYNKLWYDTRDELLRKC